MRRQYNRRDRQIRRRTSRSDASFAAKLHQPLVREAYHRVKNSLQMLGSLLRLQSSHADTDRARGQLESACQRIMAIAAVYDMISRGAGKRIRMPRCLARLCDSFCLKTETGISLTLAAEDIYLDADRALPLCLFASEAITNCLKHAFVGRQSGSIKVEMRRCGEGMLRLGIKDNGIGRTRSDPDGLGSDLLRVLSTQVDGRLVQETGPGKGCAVSVYVRE
jgi:two-component sensor histidine kinase